MVVTKKARPAREKLSSLAMGLPHDLTDQLLQRLHGLRPSRKRDYLISEITSKFVSKETEPACVRKNNAIMKWLSAERDNEATNDRLLLTHEEYNILPRVTYRSFVDRCREIIADIIGDTPPIWALIGSFSGGASTSRRRTDSHPAFKYTGKIHCTAPAWELFCDTIVDEMPGWVASARNNLNVEIVRGNVLFTVPKKTDIDRVAAKEPDLNMFMQKGVGNYYRRCLRNVGINLNDQSVNRSLAHRGSVENSLSTLDLSSASDSVTTELVAQLLPECWHTLLASLRSPVTIIDGEEHSNHMFSSMGNGFTFELESLLFYSIARTVAYFTGTRGVVSVYGDDLIIPRDMAWLLSSVLNYLGFQVNPDKSFYEGPFRESCGGHYYEGYDITPFYVRKPIDTIIDLIHVANQLREWDTVSNFPDPRSNCIGVLDHEVEEVWLWLKGFIPSTLWGGGDTSYKYQLVSYDKPQLRIQPETKKGSTGIGGYYHWLNATWARTGPIDDPTVTSRRSIHLERYRLRPVRDNAVPRLPALFLHEIEQALESYKSQLG